MRLRLLILLAVLASGCKDEFAGNGARPNQGAGDKFAGGPGKQEEDATPKPTPVERDDEDGRKKDKEEDKGSTDDGDDSTDPPDVEIDSELVEVEDDLGEAPRSDLTIQQTNEDKKDFDIVVSLEIGDKTVDTQTVKSPGKGQTITVPKLCIDDRETTLRVRIGKLDAGVDDECMHVTKVSENSQQLDFDTTGKGWLGTKCGEDGEDETLVLTCTKSKALTFAE